VVAFERGVELCRRYTKADLSVLNDEETRRFVGDGDPDPQTDVTLAWELLYRLEPELYDRLIQVERIHPAVLEWLPRHVDRIVEVAAGTGRLTAALIERCDHLAAVEPAASLRALLAGRLGRRGDGRRLLIMPGFFDSLPLPDRSAELVITCSALTPEPAHGGEAGLAEMERVCAAGGRVVLVWPNHREWLEEHGYAYESFSGEMAIEFATLADAVELAEIFYPHAVAEIQHRRERRVPYEVLGVNPPRDLAYKDIAA
jgi:SAM-dependent methyltransferase